MVIEYIGEVIRSELSELREKQYEAKVEHLSHLKLIVYLINKISFFYSI